MKLTYINIISITIRSIHCPSPPNLTQPNPTFASLSSLPLSHMLSHPSPLSLLPVPLNPTPTSLSSLPASLSLSPVSSPSRRSLSRSHLNASLWFGPKKVMATRSKMGGGASTGLRLRSSNQQAAVDPSLPLAGPFRKSRYLYLHQSVWG